MILKDVQTAIKNYKRYKITQEELGKALGIKKAAVSLKMQNELKKDEIEKICKYFDISESIIMWSGYSEKDQNGNSDDCFDVPVRGEVQASMGYGVQVYDESQTGTYSISKKLAKDIGVNLNNCEMIFAKGDSMTPTIIGGDSLLVDKSKIEIYDGSIYCVRIDGLLYAKRLQKLSNSKLKVISDNKDYEPIIIDFLKQPDIDFAVIGEVRWAGRVFK